jgi:hypothetical protein
MNKASTSYSNDYIFSMSVEIEVHQLSKVSFFSNELESDVPISICEGEELGTRDLKKLYRQIKE